jgi:hypothetical protein
MARQTDNNCKAWSPTGELFIPAQNSTIHPHPVSISEYETLHKVNSNT